MTSKDRNVKDTPTRSAGPRAVQKRKGAGESERPDSSASERASSGVKDGPGSLVNERAGSGVNDSAGSGVAQAPAEAALESVRQQLADHLAALRFVCGTLSVCVQALQQQNAEMDAEIALVLQRTADDKLDATIEQIEELAFGLELKELKEEVA